LFASIMPLSSSQTAQHTEHHDAALPRLPAWPCLPDEVIAAVGNTLRAAQCDPSLLNGLSGGGLIAEFESAFSAFVGTSHALAVSSGAAALHLALLAAGVGPGDEVILPAYGWGQILVFLDALDAVPVFADISEKTLGLDPASVTTKITERTRAIVVTHCAGVPAAVDELMTLAEQAGVTLIEDCAQALGAEIGKRPVGTIGHIGVFSFGPRKHLPCGEGGALVTDDVLLWERALVAGQHPDRAALQVSDPRLTATECFWPYRIHPIAAVMGTALLPFLPSWRAQREHNHQALCDGLRSLSWGRIIEPLPATRGAWCGLALSFQETRSSRDFFIEKLQAQGINLVAGPVQRPLHQRAEIVGRWGQQQICPVAEAHCGHRELYWRDSIGLTGQEQEFVASAINAFASV
jgi:perosamine synthetase